MSVLTTVRDSLNKSFLYSLLAGVYGGLTMWQIRDHDWVFVGIYGFIAVWFSLLSGLASVNSVSEEKLRGLRAYNDSLRRLERRRVYYLGDE